MYGTALYLYLAELKQYVGKITISETEYVCTLYSMFIIYFSAFVNQAELKPN